MNIEEVIEEAKKLVIPPEEEVNRRFSICSKVIELLRNELINKRNIPCEVSLQGSLAKDTWLPEGKDIDIFLIFQKDFPKEKFTDIVNILIKIAEENNIKWILKYAQHPYIQYIIDKYEIDIVPCYRIEIGEKPMTAADRTPLHTEYILSKIRENSQLKVEIRLFKRFLKVLSIYGAEIKVEGFSGYLAELLVVYYKSFLDTIRSIAREWKPFRIIIDIEKHYKNVKYVKKLFKDSPIIVIDPVDPQRNAAAAVSLESLSKLIVASKIFLYRPSIHFFEYSDNAYLDNVEHRFFPPIIIVEFPYLSKLSPETVWGEIKRLCRNIWNTFERYEYKVYDVSAWTNERDRIVIMIMVERAELPEYQLHKGPPVYSDDIIKFFEKYVKDGECLGPYIIDDRVVVIKRRKYYNVEVLLKSQLPFIVPKHFKKIIDKARISIVRGIDNIQSLDSEIRDIVLKFLIKREHWYSTLL